MSTEAEHTMVVLAIAGVLGVVIWAATLASMALLIRAAVQRIELRMIALSEKTEAHTDAAADRIVSAVQSVPVISVLGSSRPPGWGPGAPN